MMTIAKVNTALPSGPHVGLIQQQALKDLQTNNLDSDALKFILKEEDQARRIKGLPLIDECITQLSPSNAADFQQGRIERARKLSEELDIGVAGVTVPPIPIVDPGTVDLALDSYGIGMGTGKSRSRDLGYLWHVSGALKPNTGVIKMLVGSSHPLVGDPQSVFPPHLYTVSSLKPNRDNHGIIIQPKTDEQIWESLKDRYGITTENAEQFLQSALERNPKGANALSGIMNGNR